MFKRLAVQVSDPDFFLRKTGPATRQKMVDAALKVFQQHNAQRLEVQDLAAAFAPLNMSFANTSVLGAVLRGLGFRVQNAWVSPSSRTKPSS